jgi:hypothetical protein
LELKDLGNVLTVLDVTNKEATAITPEFRELCKLMLDLTPGPHTLFEELPKCATDAIVNGLGMESYQRAMVEKIVRNTVELTIGTLIEGGVMHYTKSASELQETLKEALTAVTDLMGEDEEGFKNSNDGEEDEFECEPATHKRKEVVH